MSEYGFETLAIHAGQEPDPATGSVVVPIHQTSTYKQDGVGGLRGGYEYSRSANPTRTALEQCLAALEGAPRALAFASGMAAEDCLLRTVCSPGDHVLVPDDAYGGTYRLFARVFSGWGLTHDDTRVIMSDGTSSDAFVPGVAGAIGIATLKRASCATTKKTVKPPNECPDIPIRFGSSAPKNGEAGFAFAASISSSAKMTSCGRSCADATCAAGVPQFGNSKSVLPGCGGAITM